MAEVEPDVVEDAFNEWRKGRSESVTSSYITDREFGAFKAGVAWSVQQLAKRMGPNATTAAYVSRVEDKDGKRSS